MVEFIVEKHVKDQFGFGDPTEDHLRGRLDSGRAVRGFSHEAQVL